MKKIIAFVLLSVVIFSSTAFAETVVGRLSLLKATEQEALALMKDSTSERFYVGLDVNSVELKFYDSFIALQMALNKGEVNVVTLPLCVGQFMLNSSPDYILKGLDWRLVSAANSFNFAFREKNTRLQNSFNKALADMRRSGKLGLLEYKHVTNADINNMETIKFKKFDGAETIKVAITGDMPPIDYVAADGTPAGFNTALLAEIGRILHVNIETEPVETAARAAALQSGRVDVVFWFESNVDPSKPNLDVPDGIILSDPYYKWNEQYFIGKK